MKFLEISIKGKHVLSYPFKTKSECVNAGQMFIRGLMSVNTEPFDGSSPFETDEAHDENGEPTGKPYSQIEHDRACAWPTDENGEFVDCFFADYVECFDSGLKLEIV